MFQDEPTTPGQPAAARLLLKVVPGSRRDQIVGPYGDRLKVKVAAPPEGGRANKAVIQLLADALSIAPRDIQVIAGLTNPEKTARITGLTAAQAQRALFPT
jgi:uncharacterized protein (TIGR00251 family)